MKKAKCPNCKEPCESVEGDRETPPWVCRPCVRGWWRAEIDAAEFWDPEYRDFGTETAAILRKVE